MEFFLAMFENETFRQDLFEIQLEHYRRRQEWFRNLAQSGQLLDLVEFTGEPGRSCDRQRSLSFRFTPFIGEGETFTGYVILKARDCDAALEMASSANTSSLEFQNRRTEEIPVLLKKPSLSLMNLNCYCDFESIKFKEAKND